MILVLGEVPGVEVTNLMARAGSDGPGKRGPVVDARSLQSGQRPLGVLREGDKLHILAGENCPGVKSPEHLIDLLAALGLEPAVRLKQIHLLIPGAGQGGQSCFAARFAQSLAGLNFQVQEVKAPSGRIRCDASGKIWIYSEASEEWAPSVPALNSYWGPGVAPKHRSGGGQEK